MNQLQHIGINRTVCVDALVEQDDMNFIALAKRVMKRDRYVCQLCHFQSTKWQQVITKNGKYAASDLVIDNLVTVCPLCFHGQRLGYAAMQPSRLSFVYLPEISQADLNNIMRLVYFYIEHPEVDHEKETLTEQEQSLIDCHSYSEAFIDELRQRTKLVKKVYKHAALSDLKTVVTMLYQLPEDKYNKRDMFFGPIRYLVDPVTMSDLNKHYSQEAFASLDGHKEVIKSQMLNLSSLSE